MFIHLLTFSIMLCKSKTSGRTSHMTHHSRMKYFVEVVVGEGVQQRIAPFGYELMCLIFYNVSTYLFLLTLNILTIIYSPIENFLLFLKSFKNILSFLNGMQLIILFCKLLLHFRFCIAKIASANMERRQLSKCKEF